MKRWILLLLVCVLLTACGTGEPTEPSDVTAPSAVTEATESTEPNLLLSSAAGVSVYQLDQEQCVGILPWGEDRYVLFTASGKLHLLTGDNLQVEKIRDLECSLTVADPSIRISDDKLCYFDRTRDAYVTLGWNLTELSAITIRDEVTAGPLMDEDFAVIYYATADGIRALDISTGNSRLLRQEHQTVTSLEGLDFEGTNLHYRRLLENGVEQDCFIRTDDGTLVEVAVLNGELVTWGRNYAAVMEFQLPLTRYREILCGNLDGTPSRLVTSGEHENILFTGQGTVLLQNQIHPGLVLELYDLETGDRIAYYSRTDWDDPFSNGCYDGENLWLWTVDSDRFIRLDVTEYEPVPGTLEPMYTLTNPAPLDGANAQAQVIADTYGVGIELSSSDNRTTGVNYDSWPDYRPQEYEAALKLLKRTMSTFPAGFFQKLKLTIRLTDDFDPAQGLPEGSGELIIGSQRIMNLSICDNMLPIFYHELFHAMELYITGETNRLSKWSELNPEGFSYANSTIPYESGELKESEFLYAVADDYGLVGPREDRAQIFMYAMAEGEDERFASETMQRKLSALCESIRLAWGWQKIQTQFPWEQYLLPTS